MENRAAAGHSSPVLTSDRIFLTGADHDKLYTFCLSRETGKILWRRECPRSRAEPLDKRNTAPRQPPLRREERLRFFRRLRLVSYGFDGNERWRTPLGPFHNIYGVGASPILAAIR